MSSARSASRDRPAGPALERARGGVGVDRDDEEVRLLRRGLEVAQVPDVEQVEQAVGERHGLPAARLRPPTSRTSSSRATTFALRAHDAGPSESARQQLARGDGAPSRTS
jgi:hypothetical protein